MSIMMAWLTNCAEFATTSPRKPQPARKASAGPTATYTSTEAMPTSTGVTVSFCA
jgi:hypothetical protein